MFEFNRLKKAKAHFLSVTCLLSMVTSGPVLAHTLTVENSLEGKNKIEVILEPGEGHILPSSKDHHHTVMPGQKKKIDMHTLNTEGNTTFSVTGKVTDWIKTPSIHNKCGPLAVDSDQHVKFTGSKIKGVTCEKVPG